MPIEFRKEDGRLVWVRSPFTGVITYFTEIHRKQSGFPRRTQVMPTAAAARLGSGGGGAHGRARSRAARLPVLSRQ